MNTRSVRFPLRSLWIALVSFLFALGAGASAQTAATGRVTGRIFNPATGEYMRNAEIRLDGSERIAYS